MKIDKTANQFDNYKLELSFGQILALRDGLKANHAMPNSDEMLRELDWYIERLPRPGEEKDNKEGGGQPGGPQPSAGGVEDIDLDSELPPPGAELGGEGDLEGDAISPETDLGEEPPINGDLEGEEELEAPPV